MTGISDGQDPVALAIAFAERLGGEALPAHAVEKLRGDRPMSSTDRVQIGEAFRRTLASPALTDQQRDHLHDLIQGVTAGLPDMGKAHVDARGMPDPDAPTGFVPPVARTVPEVPEPPPSPASSTPEGLARVVAPSAAGTGGGARRPRRWVWIAAAAGLVAALAGTSYLAWANFRTGEDWRVRAEAAQADVDRLVTANDTLQADLDELGQALRRSESDVQLLEARVSRAADEKARAEDEREMVNAYAERITEVAVAYDEVAQWFSACRDEQSALTTMVFDFESYYLTNQTYLISNQINRAAEVCGTAETSLAELRSYVQALAQ